MPNVINATSTGNGGLITQGDDSGILNIQTNETTAITVDTSQNVGIGTVSPTAKLTIDKSSDSASPSRTPADYSIRMTAAQSNTYNGGICVSESTYVNSAITPIDTGSGGAQGWAFITGNNTAIAEAMRIDSSGNLLVGTTSQTPGYGNTNTGAQLSNNGSHFSRAATDWVMTVNQNTADGSARYLIGFRVSNGQVGNIQSNGTNCTYNSNSDYRLKENIAPMTGALAKVAQLKPVTYKWKVNGSDGEGFIAHELAEVVPECVTGDKDAVDAEGKPVYQGIDTSFLVATLTAAIQEQQALIVDLQDRLVKAGL